LLAMHSHGAHTIAQDEKSCVIYGMPKEAVELGGVDEVLPLSQIAGAILAKISTSQN
jgi:two-component system, chemotaxis family, protein-glutamate methylesterase/glutaminase